MALQEWERTTDVNTKQFVEFVQFVVASGHTDEIVQMLEEKGFSQIRVSVQPIRAIQDFLRNKLAPDSKGSVVVTSAHVDGAC